MSKYIEYAKKLRNDPDIHYNCAQGVLVPFAKDAGLSEKTAFDLAFNFGGGMKMGATCGAVTGGLMVLGLFGVNDVAILEVYYDLVKKRHGSLLCDDLLETARNNNIEKKANCDGLVYECIEIVEGILKEHGCL